MNWTEAKEYFSKNDIDPRPHGPQNPLGTDHLIAKHRGVLCLGYSFLCKCTSQTVLGKKLTFPSKTFKNY
ncbi:MAG: hypothetical protein ACPLRY_00830 [Candidatus Bathyarchaeales archaeon]